MQNTAAEADALDTSSVTHPLTYSLPSTHLPFETSRLHLSHTSPQILAWGLPFRKPTAHAEDEMCLVNGHLGV